MFAAMSLNNEILGILLDSGSEINEQDNKGRTALMRAIANDQRPSVAILLSAGADVSLRDRRGRTARVVLDTSGNVIGRQGHLPFGDDFAESGTQEKHHFTNYERDGETLEDYAVNKGYAPNVGRFQQADPYRASGYIVDPQSWNRYSYTRNNPANRTDP